MNRKEKKRDSQIQKTNYRLLVGKAKWGIRYDSGLRGTNYYV